MIKLVNVFLPPLVLNVCYKRLHEGYVGESTLKDTIYLKCLILVACSICNPTNLLGMVLPLYHLSIFYLTCLYSIKLLRALPTTCIFGQFAVGSRHLVLSICHPIVLSCGEARARA